MSSDTGDPTRSGTAIVAARSFHVITIDGYSRSLFLSTQGRHRPSFNSPPFGAGGRTWHVIYKPMGSPDRPENTDYISIFLVLDDAIAEDETLMAVGTFSLLCPQFRKPVHFYTKTTITNNFAVSRTIGTDRFVKRQHLELSGCLKDDCFSIRVHLHIIKELAPPRIVVPPPDIHRHLGDLLSSKEGTDVEFRVGGETFAAHRLLLGARSPVFRAELFGPMNEGTTTDVIEIDDMEAQVFGGLLTFMYTDTWPAEIKVEDECTMAQHLLAAADRYDLQRLKLMCEDKLRKHIDASSVASILALAEQHQCPRLKNACFKFLGLSSVAFLEAIESGDYYLARSCPTVTKELISGLLARDLEKAKLRDRCTRIPLFRGLW